MLRYGLAWTLILCITVACGGLTAIEEEIVAKPYIEVPLAMDGKSKAGQAFRNIARDQW